MILRNNFIDMLIILHGQANIKTIIKIKISYDRKQFYKGVLCKN